MISEVKVVEQGFRLLVTVPYSIAFTDRAKEIGGQWRSGGKTWRFNIKEKDLVLKLLKELYNYKESGT